MRYSYWNGLSVFLDGGRREGFGRILGGLFTSALTNFVSIPTSAEWSLVWKLFGEEQVAPYGADEAGWQVKNHPVAGFHDFERRFLGMETEVYGGDTKVAIGVLGDEGEGFLLRERREYRGFRSEAVDQCPNASGRPGVLRFGVRFQAALQLSRQDLNELRGQHVASRSLGGVVGP